MKPILFNAEMVRAILAGTKTVTRRVVKGYVKEHLEIDTDGSVIGVYDQHEGRVRQMMEYAPYKPGNILYVRETFAEWTGGYVYKADGTCSGYPLAFVDRWRPSIHMPKEAARIFLRVERVRAEHLQKEFFDPICPILEVQAEGIDIGDHCRHCIDNYGEPCCVDTIDEDGSDLYGGECGMLDDPRDDFARLWDSTIKPADLSLYGWAADPWVWVIEFERCEKPEAEL